MKKVLKSDDMDEVAREFTRLFQAELRKVQTFMICQQQDVHNSLSPLELDFAPTIGNLDMQAADDHCEVLVQKITNFRHYANLNGEAIRKIIKKFDKRLNMSFHEHFVLDTSVNNLVSARDIGVWLMDPAMHCLRLMRVLGADTIGRPLNQFNFWLEELKAGAQLAREVLTSDIAPDPTSMRLGLCGNSADMAVCVKNTFIDCGTPQQKDRRRASSHPPIGHGRLVLTDSGANPQTTEDSEAAGEGPANEQENQYTYGDKGTGSTRSSCSTRAPGDVPVISVEHFVCQQLQMAPPPRVDLEDDIEDDDVGSWRFAPNRGRFDGSCNWQPGWNEPDPPFDSFPGTHQQGGASASNAYSSRGRPASTSFGASAGSGTSSRYGAGPSGGGRSAARWWTEVPDVCAVTGFPIRLLPYPPFKLQRRAGVDGAPESGAWLVDGPCVVLKVLASWKFEVLGAPLTMSDISNLDAYMKRCKLGPFRLGPALELFCKGTAEAHSELESLRLKARKRLDNVKHIQRGRLTGGGKPQGGGGGGRRGQAQAA
eukprot:CAMPEP_0178464008 /NCGR_PEP_ID=MMETSP0689_2-20121128/50624_1 /TAXON_ID=160604 /ORGANISM="Amphidinium massartii, Strain CS-259" /LENGTH=539 /DNA_ID=CAMNT_0020090903 /DNA_START=122 /DNA_END=1741 /DNA_ORIENTATION=+